MSSRPSAVRVGPRASSRARPGTAPGQLTPAPDALRSVAHILAWSPDACEAPPVADLDALRQALARRRVVWVNVDGVGDPELIASLGDLFGLHGLALEDVVHVHQRPKLERYADHLYIVLRVPETGADHEFRSEQISLFLGRNYVLTFQERAGDCWDPVRERARAGTGHVRAGGPDYLAYALIDAAVDSYFPVLEALGEQLEELEDAIIENPRRGVDGALHRVRRDLITLRRGIWPLRETLGALSRDPDPLVADETRIYLRDCYDHAVQIIDLLETYREIAGGLLDVYLSSVSNRMNETMKVLTVIATIFIPLGFVAGLWGMNFDPDASPWNMPETRWRYGYPLALGVMASVAGGLLLWFRRRGWLGDGMAETPPQNRSPRGRGGPREPAGGD